MSANPIVVSGSANFSKASSDTNDENMLIIKGDKRIADIYLGEYMRLYSHYAFREAVKHYLEHHSNLGALSWTPQFLAETDAWMTDYFDPADTKRTVYGAPIRRANGRVTAAAVPSRRTMRRSPKITTGRRAMPKARVNGVELFYEVSGDGQPVLFIHGGYGGAESAVVAKLPPEVVGILPADRFKVITYDRRNAGQSEFSEAHVTLADLADDARALLDHLERRDRRSSSARRPAARSRSSSRSTYPQRTLALCLPNTGANLMNPARPRSKRVRRAGRDGTVRGRSGSLRIAQGGAAAGAAARLDRARAAMPPSDDTRQSARRSSPSRTRSCSDRRRASSATSRRTRATTSRAPRPS